LRNFVSCAAAVALGALSAAPLHAEGMPASKHAVAYGAPAIVSEGGWQPILAQHIKTANGKGLAITLSLECGLYTKNIVKSKGVAKSDAKASVKVRVLVDGEYVADPGEITFCSRSARSSAVFAGIFDRDASVDNDTCFYLEEIDTTEPPDGVTDETVVRMDPSCLSPEELALFEDTMSAHSYFFYYGDTTPGAHTVTVEALIDEATGAEGDHTAAEDQGAKAALGKGSMLIEEIRLIQGSNGETLEF
jgi:hypothetical protein